MTARVSCSWCHRVATPGTCPVCGHDNDQPRSQCACPRCVRTDDNLPLLAVALLPLLLREDEP